MTIPEIDFGNCYKKIKLIYNISEDLLIGILDRYQENSNPITFYFLFNPKNGEKINASEICKDENIIMKEDVLTFPGVDSSLIKFFADQDINVFNISDKFYSDICKHYNSPNGKDIPLNLRFKIFFPNISLCDEGCISKGVELKTMRSICHCPFTDLTKNSFIASAVEYSESLGEIYSFISNSNINVLFCIKNIFNIKYFKRCIGGFIIIILIFFISICVFVYFLKSKNDIRKYMYIISKSFIEYSIISMKNEPPKRGINKIKTGKNIQNKKKKHKISSRNLNSSSSYKFINSINKKDIKLDNIKIKMLCYLFFKICK